MIPPVERYAMSVKGRPWWWTTKPRMRQILSLQLTKMGLSRSDGGERARGAANGPHGRLDLVLTDLKMPGMEGDALLREIRKDFPALPVILMTAFGDGALGRRGDEGRRVRPTISSRSIMRNAHHDGARGGLLPHEEGKRGDEA
jgi:hypothetical protein